MMIYVRMIRGLASRLQVHKDEKRFDRGNGKEYVPKDEDREWLSIVIMAVD